MVLNPGGLLNSAGVVFMPRGLERWLWKLRTLPAVVEDSGLVPSACVAVQNCMSTFRGTAALWDLWAQGTRGTQMYMWAEHTHTSMHA